MKRRLLIFLCIWGITLGHTTPVGDFLLVAQPVTSNVYICNSPTSIAYHASSICRGLNRCIQTIIKVSLSDAKKVYGKRACKICYQT